MRRWITIVLAAVMVAIAGWLFALVYYQLLTVPQLPPTN